MLLQVEKMSTKKLTILSILTAVSLVLGYIESLFILPFPVPGIKLGLANVAILLAIYILGRKQALLLLLAKVLLSAVLFAGLAGTLYSLIGGLLSWFTMSMLYKHKGFSPAGVSVAGAAAHNLGQILIAMLLTGSTVIFSYFPVLLFAGTIFGLITGIIAYMVIYAMNKNNKISVL